MDEFYSCPLSEHNVRWPVAFCGNNVPALASTSFSAANTGTGEAFRPGDKWLLRNRETDCRWVSGDVLSVWSHCVPICMSSRKLKIRVPGGGRLWHCKTMFQWLDVGLYLDSKKVTGNDPLQLVSSAGCVEMDAALPCGLFRKTMQPGIAAHTCNNSTGGAGRRTGSLRPTWTKSETLSP